LLTTNSPGSSILVHQGTQDISLPLPPSPSLSCVYLLINETEERDADLHAQVVQAEDGGLQEEEAGGEEEAEAQRQVVSLGALWGVEGVERGDDPPQQLWLDRLGSLLGDIRGGGTGAFM